MNFCQKQDPFFLLSFFVWVPPLYCLSFSSRLFLGDFQGLGKVLLDVLDVLDSHGDTDEFGIDPRVLLLAVGQLLVGGGGGVDDQGPHISHVGEVGGQLDRVNKLGSGGPATLDAKSKDTSEAVLEVLLGVSVVGVVFKAGVGDPGNFGALLKPLGKGKGVGNVLLGGKG